MSAAPPVPVLFAHYGDEWFRGSEQLLFDLMTHLDRAQVEPVLWCNGAPLAEAARKAGITTYRSPFEIYFDYDSPRFSMSRYLGLVRQGIGLVCRHGIRVIHANSAAPHQWMLPVARATRRPVLAHLHIDYRRRGRYVCLLHQADMIVGVSRQVTQDFLRDGMRPDRVRTIYNGIDASRLLAQPAGSIRRDLGIADGTVVIATVGSLIPRKGMDVLIRAMARLVPQRDVCLLVAGDGPDREALRAQVGSSGLDGKVRFLGYDRNVAAIYRASDLIAQASRAESFGLVLAEAALFERPAVATAVGGISEVIEDGVTGLLVPPEDADALARALSDLIDHPVRRQAMGQAAKAMVEDRFSVARMVSGFHAAYHELAAIPPARLGWFGDALSLRPYANAVLGRTA